MFVKDPDAVKDYGIDWDDWLNDVGDTISVSEWIVPQGLTAISNSKTTLGTTVWLSGGNAGESYRVTNRITTVGGRIDDRSILLKCKEQ